MRRLARPAVLLGALWLLAGVPASAPAQEQPLALGGFSVNAWGSGATWIYDQPGSPIPASPTAEMHGAYSLATLGTGPAGHAVGAEIWPGPVAATVGPFIEDSFWSGFNSGGKDFANQWNDGTEPAREGGLPLPEQEEPEPVENPQLVPKQYPAGAEVFLPPGGEQRAPFAHARAADLDVESDTASVELLFPGVMVVRDAASSARSAVDTVTTDTGEDLPTAVGRATSTAKGVSFLGGLVKVDEVATVATVTSDGTTATIGGRTVVSGLSINGQGFTIDEGGIHADGEEQDNPITGQFNENAARLLADSGMRITLAQPVDTVDGAQGSRSAGGLIVEISAARVEEAFSQLPDELENQLRGQGLGFTQTVTVVLAAVNVGSGAAEGFAVPEFEFGFDAAPSGFVGTQVAGEGVTAGDDAPVTLNATPAPVVRPAPGQRFATQPAFAAPVDVDGVGAAGAAVALLTVLGAATLLRRFSDALVAPPGAAAACDDA